ncbi:MAG: glutamate--cysteine ligase [Pseudomonadaceae bacterium]|nr:glutamate--cysteine ligase [Pseudomonadaceae bacterium]
MTLAADLAALANAGPDPLLARGVEKESLRVAADGNLSERAHPPSLGSALTHPNITTDFSESQLELITGVHTSIDDCVRELTEVHQFVHANLDGELMWPGSMPCMVGAADDVPIGQYGSSNIAQAKSVYRRGLANRYGALMQTISGIHYNFSLTETAWTALASARGHAIDRTDAYLGLIRNFRRYSWLLIYLFGASPAVCKSFTRGMSHGLQEFDHGTHYLPHATSLRMGRLGYQSDAQKSLHISYNNLDDYAETMRFGLTTPYPDYEAIGVIRDGEYQQLNTSLLQIENEFYGTIRPKRTIATGERPLTALTGRGVEYVEVRCMDLNPYISTGIDAETMRFLDTFLLSCLLSESPLDTPAESQAMQDNQIAIVERGREPGLTLNHEGSQRSMQEWAQALLTHGDAVASMLDGSGPPLHQQALAAQLDKINDPSLTASARIVDDMNQQGVPFFRLTMNLALEHADRFASSPLSATELAEMAAVSEQSHAKQADIEASESESFEVFLERYLALP